MTNLPESTIQADIVKWVRFHYPHLTIFHIPNGEVRSASVGRKLKRMGVLKGVFDLYLMDYHLFIEVKRTEKDKLSLDQLKFKTTAVATNHKVMEVHGFKEAVAKLREFLQQEEQPNKSKTT